MLVDTIYTITYSVTDRAGASASVSYRATVVPPPVPPPPPPSALSLPGIPNFRLPSGGVIDTVFPAATGGRRPYSYGVSGLPPGISFSSRTLRARGTLPTVLIDTTYTITYSVRDSRSATASVTFTAVVVAATVPAPPPQPDPQPPPDDDDNDDDGPGVSIATVYNLPFTVLETGEREKTYRFSLSSSGEVTVSLTGMNRDIDCRVNSSSCTNRGGTSDDSWRGTLGTGTHTVTVYPYGGGSGSWTLSVTGPAGIRPADPPTVPVDAVRLYSLPFTVSETGEGEKEYRFSLDTSTEVSVSLTGMNRDIDCRVNSSRCTNRGGTRDDSWSGTLAAGTHKVTVYPYNADSGNWTLSVSGPATSPPPPPAGTTPASRYFKLSLPWESEVAVDLTGMTIDFDCRVNASNCTNRRGTRDDFWSGTLPAGNHVIVVYPYRPGSGSYSLSMRVSPTASSSYYGTVAETETLVGVSETNVSSSRSYSFSLTEGTEVSVDLTALTIDFDCRVDGMRCTNLGGTRDDSWSGWLAAGEHTVEVYPYVSGPGNYSLTVGSSSTVTYVASPFGAGPRARICEEDENGQAIDGTCATVAVDRDVVIAGEAPILVDVAVANTANQECHSFTADTAQHVEFKLTDRIAVAGRTHTYSWAQEVPAGTHSVCINRRTSTGGSARADRYALTLTGLGELTTHGLTRVVSATGETAGTMKCEPDAEGQADADKCVTPPPTVFDETTTTANHIFWVFLPWPADFWVSYTDDGSLGDELARYGGHPEYDADGDGVMDDLMLAADFTDCRSRNLAEGERFGAPRGGRKHGGIDLNTGGRGSLFYSPAAGALSYHDQWALDSNGEPIPGTHAGCGHYARVTTEGGHWTICHLDEGYDAQAGPVFPGTYVGLWGGTGNHGGPHLHVGFKNRDWQDVNPLSFVGDDAAIAAAGWTFQANDPESCTE